MCNIPSTYCVTDVIWHRTGVLSCSVTSNSLQPHGLQPTRLLCLWNFPGKITGVGCHFFLQGIFPIQGSNLCLVCLLLRQVDSLPLVPSGKPPEEVPQSQIWEDKMTKWEITSDSCKREYNGFFRKRGSNAKLQDKK